MKCRGNCGSGCWEANKIYRSKLQQIARMNLSYLFIRHLNLVQGALIESGHRQIFRLATRSCNKLLPKLSAPAWNALKTRNNIFPKILVWPFEGDSVFSDPIEKYQQLLSTPHPPKCAQEFFKIRKCAKILPPKRPNSVENDTEKIKTKLRKILSQDESSRNARISAYDTQANK